ncbi:hypothetical protein ACI1US_01690 [Leucobacter sp. BZR 635]
MEVAGRWGGEAAAGYVLERLAVTAEEVGGQLPWSVAEASDAFAEAIEARVTPVPPSREQLAALARGQPGKRRRGWGAARNALHPSP